MAHDSFAKAETDTESINAIGSTAFMSNAERALAGGFVPAFDSASEKGRQYLEEWKQIRSKVPPLFYDGFSPIFFSDYAWQLWEGYVCLDEFHKFDDRAVFQGLRTVFTDRVVLQAIAGGTKQVVYLGAGLDATAMRLHAHAVKSFEVDQEPVLTYKVKRLAEAGYPNYPAKLIMADYFKIDLVSELRSAGLDCSAPVLFVWMGNQPYLPLDLTKTLLTALFENIPLATLVFDGCKDKLDASAEESIENVFRNLKDLLNGGKEMFFGRADPHALAKSVNARVEQSISMRDFGLDILGSEECISEYLLANEDRLHFWRSVGIASTLNTFVKA